MTGGGLAHCTLPSNSKSLAVKHKTVEEIWFFIEGSGEFWRSHEEDEGEETPIEPGICITIPPKVNFQFRSFDRPLKSIIVTMPPWPGPNEAIYVKGHW